MRALPQVLIALFCWFAFPGFAAVGATPAQVTFSIKRLPDLASPTSRRITLDVVVTDHSGKPVHGLQQQDFTLLDNKKPQAILSFREAGGSNKPSDPPMQAIVVIDAINDVYRNVASEREQLKGFLRQGGGELPLPTSLISFPDKSKDQPLVTQDGNALADTLNSNNPGLRSFSNSQGEWGGVERLQLSIPTLEQLVTYEVTQPGRKLLIWLGAGWPLIQSTGLAMPDKDLAEIFRNVVWLSTKLREGRITLYNVVPSEGMGGAFFYTQFLKGVDSPSKVQGANLGLQVLAEQSGGLVLNRSNDMADSMATCVEDAKAYYTLTFDSAAAHHADEYHSLQVKIDKPRLTARTRRGYYAQP